MPKLYSYSIRHRDYQFTFKPGFFTLCAIVVIVCCLLGIWQIYRYQQKKILLIMSQQRIHAPPVPLVSLQMNAKQQHGVKITDLPFKNVTLNGIYINSLTVLLQNRFYHDQLGFEVLTPVKIANDPMLLLIDRGWISKPKQTALPTIASPTKQQLRIVGYIKLLNEYQFTLGANILDTTKRPLVAQKIDLAELSKIYHRPIYPFILRLEASQPYGYVRDWTISTILPERHLAYAIQWFLFAIIGCITYVAASSERVIR